MDINEVILKLDERFTSGNDVPVSQARITKEEWELIVSTLHELQEGKAHVQKLFGKLAGVIINDVVEESKKDPVYKEAFEENLKSLLRNN